MAGRSIRTFGEVAQLTQEIQSGAQTTREPVYSMRANSYGVNDLGNTYMKWTLQNSICGIIRMEM